MKYPVPMFQFGQSNDLVKVHVNLTRGILNDWPIFDSKNRKPDNFIREPVELRFNVLGLSCENDCTK